MPRFVILTHDWPFPHFDLLIEAGGVLRAWRLLSEPKVGETVAAEPIGDHRLFYLDYEGPVSGNRGSVARWDTGECEWLPPEPNRVKFELRGTKLIGLAVIDSTDYWMFRLTAPAE